MTLTHDRGRRITVGQLRQNPTQMLSDVQDGASYAITSHGRVIADVVPHTEPEWVPIDRVLSFLSGDGDLDWAEELRAERAEGELRDPWS